MENDDDILGKVNLDKDRYATALTTKYASTGGLNMALQWITSIW